MRALIRLYTSKAAPVRRGHPWIFPKAIKQYTGKIATGDLVEIEDEEGAFVGLGIYNEHSLYRIRVLDLSSECARDISFASLIIKRLREALCIRQALGLPNNKTSAFRLFNSEADGLSGLTIDWFDSVCVVASSAFWVEAHRELICSSIEDVFKCKAIRWLSQEKPLKQDGWSPLSQASDDTLLTKDAIILEAGVRFRVNFAQGQKTGLFLDQRENHQRIAALAANKRVLDLYTYTGGFALHAALAGASHVTAVDSSAQAISDARFNAHLNQVDKIDFIEGDARDYLHHAREYDLIILDPPKLVPSKQHAQRAKNYYRFLHREVFKAMKSGSLLMTCNCSSALSSLDFCLLVSSQAAMVNKQVRILGVFGPASCHPSLPVFPEGSYLTAVLLAMV